MARGLIEKEEKDLIKGGLVSSKLLVGDNFGHVHLIDTSRKQILDMIEIDQFKGRRIISISACTLEWIDTRLTYAAVVARGSPFINVIVFKHNENKMYQIYNINTCPDLENPQNPEKNEKQTYTILPCNSSFSLDGEFLQVTSFDGRVRVVKMPPIIDPLPIDSLELNAKQSNSNMGGGDSRTYL